MLLVIFGAGASFDSVPFLHPNVYNGPDRPPLADQLFESRASFLDAMSRYPRIKAIIPRLLGGSVENKLEELLREGAKNHERLKQLTAVRYYLQDIVRRCQDDWLGRSKGITNYRSLLDEVEGWRQSANVSEVFLVTFNYDTILENALAEDNQIRFRARTTADYVSGQYKVIKPHGSINWTHHISQHRGPPGRPRNYDELIDQLINSADSLRIDPSIDVDLDAERDLVPRIPAIVIPVEAKSEYECPKEHLQQLWQYLPKVKLMMTIGWRANEKSFVDRLVLGLPSDLRTLVVSSGAPSADERVKHLQTEGLRGEIFPSHASGFTDFEKSVEAARFLREPSSFA